VAAHVDFVPARSLLVGGSFAVGPYLNRAVEASLPAGSSLEEFDQVILGANAEVSFGHLDVIGEVVHNEWTSPFVIDEAGTRSDLTSTAWYVEGRYAVSPGAFVAVRAEGIHFGSISDGAGGTAAWDDDVKRIEGGLGYYLTDQTIGKFIVQYVDKEGSRGFREAFPAVQLSISF
jgi:hypothetical protein